MHWIRRHGGIGRTILFPLLGLLAVLFAWPLLLLPQIALMIPACACWLERRVGMLSALALIAILCVSFAWLLGPMAGLMALLVLAPTFALSVYQFRADTPFWQSGLINCLLLAATGTGILLILQWYLGMSPVTAAVAGFEALLEDYPMKSEILMAAYYSGWARTSELGNFAMQTESGIVLLPTAVNELTQSLLTTLDVVLRNSLPAQIITGSMLGGILSVAWPRWAAAQDMDVLHPPAVPALYHWYIPNPVLGKALIAMLVLFMLAGTGMGSMSLAFQLAWVAFQCALALQGIASLDHQLRKRNMRRGTRSALIVLLYVLLNSACVMLGILDAIFNFRRIPPDGRGSLLPFNLPKNDEEDDDL